MSEAFQELSAGLLADGYGVRFHASGHSMLPLIKDGEAIIIEPLDARSVRRGDILLYRRGRGVIAHRVVKIERADDAPCRFTLRGDASASPDAPITSDEILGRVSAVERDNRTLRLSGRCARARWRFHQFVEQTRTVAILALSLTKRVERD